MGVALYEMTRPEHATLPAVSMVKAHEKDTLYAAWWQLTGQLAYPQHRRKQSLQMIRRVIGRAGITSWEYHRFMGLLSRALKANRAWPIRRDELPDVSDLAEPVEGDVDEDV